MAKNLDINKWNCALIVEKNCKKKLKKHQCHTCTQYYYIINFFLSFDFYYFRFFLPISKIAQQYKLTNFMVKLVLCQGGLSDALCPLGLVYTAFSRLLKSSICKMTVQFSTLQRGLVEEVQHNYQDNLMFFKCFNFLALHIWEIIEKVRYNYNTIIMFCITVFSILTCVRYRKSSDTITNTIIMFLTW